jgi:predicted ester cyclase
MSTEENKALIRRYFEAIDTGNVDILDEFLAPNFVEHTPLPGMSTDLNGWKQAFKVFLTASPGYHTVDDLIAEGDKVVGRITGYGTHEGELFGIPRTGKQIQITGISIWRIADGKIVEHWQVADMFGLMQQIGVVPPRGQAIS